MYEVDSYESTVNYKYVFEFGSDRTDLPVSFFFNHKTIQIKFLAVSEKPRPGHLNHDDLCLRTVITSNDNSTVCPSGKNVTFFNNHLIIRHDSKRFVFHLHGKQKDYFPYCKTYPETCMTNGANYILGSHLTSNILSQSELLSEVYKTLYCPYVTSDKNTGTASVKFKQDSCYLYSPPGVKCNKMTNRSQAWKRMREGRVQNIM